jgi:dihydrofolate synthase/folylpolyglutamate synthase
MHYASSCRDNVAKKWGMIMNYQEALAYIYSFSDFERGSAYTRNVLENLPREAALLAALGNPHQQYTTTHVAGTKGKGSTSAMIERVLRAAGIRMGLYTQPDLHTYRERMRVNGRLISEDELAQLVPEVRAAVEQVQASTSFGPFITYEVSTALTFLYFWRQQVQHAVIEVGVGGRLDATNVLMPLVSVISSISFDHMNVLGDTLAKIATEKAGIIKPHGIVVTSAQSVEALLAIAAVQQRQEASLLRAGSAEGDPAQAEVDAGRLPPLHYRYRLQSRNGEQQRFTVWTPMHTYEDLDIPLAGHYQLENATLAVAALEQLRKHGLAWDETALRTGLRTVSWPARIDVVGQHPLLIVDGAHNADSMQKLMQALQDSFTYHRLIAVVSVHRDKDIAGIVRALQICDRVIVTHMHNARAASIETLQQAFATYAPEVPLNVAHDTQEALNLAMQLASDDDLICATGSIYFAGEALRWSAARGNQRAARAIEGVDHP